MSDSLSEREQSVLNQLREGILVLNRDLLILSANPSFCSLFESAPEEIEGKLLPSLASGAEDRLLLSSPVGGENIRARLKTPRGKVVRTEMSFSPLLGQSSQLNGYAVLVTNISDRSLREEKTLMMLEKYRDIAFAGADWLWEIDSAGTYVYVSPSVERFLGYKPDDLFGRTPFDFMPEEEAARVTSIFSRISLNGTPLYNIQNRIFDSSGKERILLTNGVPVFDSSGNLKGYRGSDRDVTESIRIGEELKKSLAQTRMLLESLPVGVVIVDRQKRIRQINSTAQRITGMSSEDVTGEVCHKLLCPAMENRCPILDLDQSIDRDEREVLHRDGRRIPVIKTVIPIRMDSEDLLLEVFTDISEIQDVKSALKDRNEELQIAMEEHHKTARASVKKAELKASLHRRFLSEVVTALSGIAGYSELMGITDSREQSREYILRLQDDVDRLSGTLDLLRDRQEGLWGETQQQKHVMSPDKFRHRVMEAFCKSAQSGNVTFMVQIDDTLPEFMAGPAQGAWIILSKIIGAVLNLHFLESILIGISSSGDPSEPGMLRFSVTGAMETILERSGRDMNQLDSDVQICCSQAESLGGRLQILSGQGTGFVGILYLPFEKLNLSMKTPAVPVNAFVVCNDPHLAGVYQRVLEIAGCTCVEMLDPLLNSDASPFAGKNCSTVLVIDVDLIEFSFDFVQNLKVWKAKEVINQSCDIYTVLLSSGAVAEQSIRSSGLEYQALLLKPVRAETFRKCFHMLHLLSSEQFSLVTDFSIPDEKQI